MGVTVYFIIKEKIKHFFIGKLNVQEMQNLKICNWPNTSILILVINKNIFLIIKIK